MKGQTKFICISGPDGVGKTTQARLLLKHLRTNGRRADYVWLRFNHLISLPILVYMRIRGLSYIKELPDGQKIGFHKLENRRLLSKTYALAIFSDLSLASIYKITIRRIVGRDIVCDRHAIDAIIDISMNTSDSTFPDSRIGELFLNLSKKSENIILVADPEILKTRRSEINFDSGLGKRVELYHRLAQKNSINVIDIGHMSIEDTLDRILEEINL